MRLPAPLQVFIGGTIGGALRIVIDHAVPAGAHGLPWDIIAINVVGSFALGVVAARSEATGGHRYFPLVGPGVLGGFTTFSALAALLWVSSMGTFVAGVVLAANVVLAVAAAAWGWTIGAQGARIAELVENLENEPDDDARSRGPRASGDGGHP